MWVYVLLRVFHITVAALWFGAPLGMVGLLRGGLASGPEAFKMSCDLVGKKAKISGIAGILTLLSGIAIIFQMGGFGSVPVPIHIAMGLVLVRSDASATVAAFGGGLRFLCGGPCCLDLSSSRIRFTLGGALLAVPHTFHH